MVLIRNIRFSPVTTPELGIDLNAVQLEPFLEPGQFNPYRMKNLRVEIRRERKIARETKVSFITLTSGLVIQEGEIGANQVHQKDMARVIFFFYLPLDSSFLWQPS